MRAYPGWYRSNSVYTMFPLTTPDENMKILKDMGKEADYTNDRPSLVGAPTPVTTWQGVVDVLGDQAKYKVPCKCESVPRVF